MPGLAVFFRLAIPGRRCATLFRPFGAWGFEGCGDVGGGFGGLGFGDLFGGSLGDDLAAVGAGFRAEVDDVVGLGSEVHVVFDDDDGVSFIDEAVEDVGEAGDVLLVEADGGFLDEVEIGVGGADVGYAGSTFGELGDELESLGFASGDSGAGLSEGEVTEAGFG